MKDFFDKAIELAIQNKDYTCFNKIARELCSEYGVSLKTVHTRFHSMFGCGFAEYVKSRIYPTKDEVEAALMCSSSSDECRANLMVNRRMYSGIYDKYFGVSTYTAAKECVLMSAPVKVRLSSLREDNLAILMSQYLGDGSYNRERHALRIQHGIKQGQYLRWKVGLLFEGYNKVSTRIVLREHKQGHSYYDYYSGKLGHVVFPHNKEEAVPLLTPLGWLLWYLDDGTYGQDISLCMHLEATAIAAMSELLTYGVTSRVNKCSNVNAYTVTMCGGANSVLFYKNFIEPFISIIPECMLYKTEVKI